MVEDRGPKGTDILNDPALNKSTAFSEEERDSLGLRGLLPAAVCTQEVQIKRVLANIRRKNNNIERYIFLISLLNRNERLFYRIVLDNIDELLPVVYTPTVGQACREFAHIFRQPRGLYITAKDRGRVAAILDNWAHDEVRVIVITDGERVLGLGDLGANGMGIPIGKLALYVACAGIHPEQCLPVMLDVGTNNLKLRDDPLYLGIDGGRQTGPAYDGLVDEFVRAVEDKFPRALIQFEDFLTPNAYRLLNRYRDQVLCFNDDIQGTAAMALAGILASTRISGLEFTDIKIMFLGAGSAATGIADLMVRALTARGLSEQEARNKLWFVDINGLVVKGRDDLLPHNLPYAHDHPAVGFMDAISQIRPHILIGATGAAGTFTQAAVRLMSEINPRPGIFALSNPTSRAECTAEQAYEWSDGRAIFTSGSPFPPVELNDGRTVRPSQGNNVYIFPGIGLGVIASSSRRVTESMFLAAAEALAGRVSEADLEAGAIYPPLADIRAVSLEIAVAVAKVAFAEGRARVEQPDDLAKLIAASVYDPTY